MYKDIKTIYSYSSCCFTILEMNIYIDKYVYINIKICKATKRYENHYRDEGLGGL